jgi:hypothetical protein
MRKLVLGSMMSVSLLVLLFRAVSRGDAHDDELARMDYEVFERDTLSYWIDRFDFEIPLSVRDLPHDFRAAPRRITLSPGPKLDQELIKVTSRIREYEDFFNYAHFKQREGKRFSPSGKPDQQMFAYDGRLNESRFEILGDSLGTIYMASIVYEHGVRTVYLFDGGKLQMIFVRKNTPMRTG